MSNTDGKCFLNMSSGRLSGKHIDGDWDASSSIKKPISHSKLFPWLTFNKKVEVKTTRLDTWVKANSLEFIDFIWSDIQGAERDMIEGAVNTLKIVKYLYTEYGAISIYPEAMTRSETIELMQKHNFEIIPEYSDTGDGGLVVQKYSFIATTLEENGELATAAIYDWAKNPTLRAKKAD